MNKFDGLMNAAPCKRYKSFVTTIADAEKVWLDCEPNLLLSKQCPVSVWPEEMFASAVCSDKAMFSIDVHDFCELLMDCSNRPIRVFPNGINSADTTADALLADIEEALDQVE